jgi:PAS domain-containing protein
MPAAPLPDNEFARMQSLASLDVLDSAPERGFDALVKAAALVCGVPISLISLIDTDRQWFKANHGLPSLSETPRDLAFCTHAIHDDAILEVEDASLDPRFSDNTMVTGDPSIRFYAGATLRLTDGSHVGTLCVIDRQPRRIDATQRAVLGHLATAAVAALEQRHGARARADGEARLASIIEGTGVGTWEWNVQGGQMRFNVWPVAAGNWPRVNRDLARASTSGRFAAFHRTDEAALFRRNARVRMRTAHAPQRRALGLGAGQRSHYQKRFRRQPAVDVRNRHGHYATQRTRVNSAAQ